MTRALLLAAHLLAPDCQWLCLGKCYYDWVRAYCVDSRVARLGEWDVVPWGYEPPRESSFPAWPIPYPLTWGSYSTEVEP